MKRQTVHRGEFPFLRLLVPFLCGVFVGLHCEGISFWLLATCTFFQLIILLFTHFNYKKLHLWRYTSWLGFGICIFLFFSGWWLAESHKDIHQPKHFSNSASQELIIIINQEPKLSGDILRFTADVKQAVSNSRVLPVTGQLVIALKTDTINKIAYRYGDELLIRSKFTETEPPYNPAEFNYKRFLQNQNIRHQTFINESQVRILGYEKGNPVISYAKKLRQKLVLKLTRNMQEKEAVAVASTLLLGYRASLNAETLSAYSRTGTLHVLSVSGMHVALLYIVISKLLGLPILTRKNRWLNPAFSILLIWAYALITGFSPSVNRAALMITLLIIGKTFNRDAHSLNVLAFSAFALLIYNPFYLADVGFQLSYLAVFGLIVLQPAIQKLWQPENRFARLVWSACCVSLAAQLVTSPLSLYYFHQFPVYFLVSNLFIVLPSAAIMYVGVLFLLCPDGWLITQWLGLLLEKCIVLTNSGLHIIEKWPWASVDRVWISMSEYLLLTMAVGALSVFIIFKTKKALPVMLILLLFFSISTSLKKIKKLRQKDLVFFSFRKNTAVAFHAQNKAVIFSDLNQKDKAFRYSIQPWLDSSAIRHYKLVSAENSFKMSIYQQRGNLIQAGNIVLLLYDKTIARKQSPKPFNVDVVYVTGNPKTNLQTIRQTASFKMLMIDGRNSDRLIRQLSAEANANRIPFYSLKRNPAFIQKLP